MIGTQLAHYRITGELGAGGMGEVWRAVDEKLGREVALKVLPADFAEDPERLARFEREAKVLASLNHPSIAHLYGLETAAPTTATASEELGEGKGEGEGEGGGSRPQAPTSSGPVTFLVMELVEGEDLSDRIARGAIPVDEAIPIALQIAEALEAAHEADIVHRDLKPANIKIRPDGAVKVLDFGLAKAWETEAGDSNLSLSPTMTQHATMEGVILGTAAYMAPEQARGKKVDRRADIWAFGVVLWEMLTGRRLFEGETAIEILGSIFRQEISLEVLPQATPRSLAAVIGRCLDRDPRTRLRDIGEARIAIAGSAGGPATADPDEAVAAPSNRGPRRLAAIAMLATGAVLGGIAGWLLKPAAAPPTRRLALAAPAEIKEPRIKPRISPDGRSMAYFADGRMWLQSLDQLTARAVPGSGSATLAAWSPDGSELAVAAGSEIRRVTQDGGNTLVTAEGSKPSVSHDGALLYSTVVSEGHHQLAIVGHDGAVVLEIGEPVQHADNIRLSPDGRSLAVCIEEGKDSSLWVFDLERASRNRLVFQAGCGGGQSSLAWAPDGSAVVYGETADRTIRQIRTDGGSGEATVLAEGAQPELSPDGTLLVSTVDGDIWVRPMDGSSAARPLTQTAAQEVHSRVSPAGDLVAYVLNETGRSEVYIRRFPSGDGRWQVSQGGGEVPVWSRAGDRITYLKDDALVMEVGVATGPEVRVSGVRELFSANPTRLGPNHGFDITADGRQFLMVHYGDPKKGSGDLILVTDWK